MAKIKLTKNELKTQRDALKRFERYLPTLQLKKQQLQMEVRKLEARIEEKRKEEEDVMQNLRSWLKLFSEPFDFESYVQLKSIQLSQGNVAGVAIPVLEDLAFETKVPDLYASAPWVDTGLEVLEHLLYLRVERLVMSEQIVCLKEELRTTNQRVNLFEKVKIPESKEGIRKIRVFLGDQETAAVARAKIAKSKTLAKR